MDGRCRARGDRGAAALEFAIVVIPLLYLVFGIISYGYMLTFRQAMSQGAAEGARAAAVAPAGLPDDDLRRRALTAVNGSLETYGVACLEDGDLRHDGTRAGSCDISDPQDCTASSTEAAQCVRVELDYEYRDNSLLPDVGYGYVMPGSLTFSTEVQVTE